MVSLWYGQEDVCLDVNFLKTDYCTLLDDQGCSQEMYSGRCTKSLGGVQSGTYIFGQDNRVLALLCL